MITCLKGFHILGMRRIMMSKVWVVRKYDDDAIVGVYTDKAKSKSITITGSDFYIDELELNKDYAILHVTLYTSGVLENGTLRLKKSPTIAALMKEKSYLSINKIRGEDFEIEVSMVIDKIHEKVPDAIPADYLMKVLNKHIFNIPIGAYNFSMDIYGDDVYK